MCINKIPLFTIVLSVEVIEDVYFHNRTGFAMKNVSNFNGLLHLKTFSARNTNKNLFWLFNGSMIGNLIDQQYIMSVLMIIMMMIQCSKEDPEVDGAKHI